MGIHPLVLFGDFNEIMSENEKEGGVLRAQRPMDAFREALDDCALRDLGYKGSPYTWKRGNTVSTLFRERLDRFVANLPWCSIFPETIVFNMAIHNSDHARILLKDDDLRDRGAGERLKKFEAL